MNDLATRTVAPIVRNTSQLLGVELPKPITEALEAANMLRTYVLPAQQNLTAAYAEAVLAGRDPLASKAVQQAILSKGIAEANIDGRLRSHGDQLAARAIVDHADALFDTWRPAVEKAGEAIARFRALVPGSHVLDPAFPTGLPIKALTPWGEAKEAALMLDKMTQGWVAVASAGAVYMPDSTRALIVADLTFEQANELGHRGKASDVARFDVPISLASFETFAERVQKVTEARAEHQAHEASAPDRARAARRQQAAEQMKRVRMVMIP